MEFSEIEIKDMFSFCGTQRLSFPKCAEGEKALVLVMATNTAGKTNLIRAIRFMLHGDLCGEDRHPERLVNDRRFAALGIGDTLEAWVQIKVTHVGNAFTFRRKITVMKSSKGTRSLNVDDIKLGEIKHDARGDYFIEDEGVIRRALDRMVPGPLFDYFFFEGESLAQKLLDGGASARGIKAGLATLLHDRQWQDAYDAALKVRDSTSKQLHKLTAEHESFNRLLRELEDIQSSIEVARRTRDEAMLKRDQAAQEGEKADNLLEELASGRDIQKVVNEHKKARDEFALFEKAMSKCEQDLATELGRSRGLAWLQPSFNKARKILEKMREQNLLPADVSEAFVSRLLESDSCICGNSFQGKDGAKAREKWEAYRKFTLSVDVNSALQQLSNQLEPDSMLGFDAQVKSTTERISQLLSDLERHTINLEDSRQRMKEADTELENSNVEQIKEARMQQRQAKMVYQDAVKVVSDAESRLKQLAYREKLKNDEIKKAGKGGKAAQAAKLHEKMRRASELASFIDEGRAQLMQTFHRKLQKSIRSYYDPVVADNTKAIVDERTLLPAVEADGQIRRNIGGSQRQLLVLSHIVSLSHLRQWLYTELANVGIKLGTLDEQTFMLDSIFGPLADNYRRECARFIPGKVKQLVLMVTSDQWDDIVREEIEPHVTKAYRLVKSTTNHDIVMGEKPTLFRNQEYKQARALPEGELDFTVIEEINV